MSGINKFIDAMESVEEFSSESLSELYHENTKLYPATIALSMPIEKFSTSEVKAMVRAHKQYPLVPRIKFPSVENNLNTETPFDEVISSRRSVRDFINSDLSLDNLSKILHQSYGISGEITLPGGISHQLRASPSAGALYPAEIYLAVRKVTGLEPGIYHYNVPNHELELLNSVDPTESVYEICCQQDYARNAAVIFFISGVLQRTKRKYGERGYRYVLLDVGHLGQNIYLSCTALGLAVMTTCAFFDDEANDLVHLDGIDETMIYVAFVGNSLKNKP